MFSPGKIKINTVGVENCMAKIEKILENIMDINEIVHVEKAPESPNYNTQITNKFKIPILNVQNV